MTTHLFDHLRDIVQHTTALGIIDLVKVSGTTDETTINAVSDDKSVIIQAKTKGAVPEFIGTFGMPNLGKLNIILGIPEYKENAVLSVVRKNNADANSPLSGIHFANKGGDFKNDYRFMGEELVNDKVRSMKFKGVTWNIDIEPTNNAIQKFKYQASANSEETVFSVKMSGSDLQFNFGDHSSHGGSFVFATGVNAKFNQSWSWPVNVVLSILGLPGDKALKFSDEGAAMITVDSGLIDYEFIIPAQQK